jgi:hypothetical protein
VTLILLLSFPSISYGDGGFGGRGMSNTWLLGASTALTLLIRAPFVSSSYLGGGSPERPPDSCANLRWRLVRRYKAVASAPPRTMAPIAIPIPAAAAVLRPPEPLPGLETGVDSGSWPVVFGFSGLVSEVSNVQRHKKSYTDLSSICNTPFEVI